MRDKAGNKTIPDARMLIKLFIVVLTNAELDKTIQEEKPQLSFKTLSP